VTLRLGNSRACSPRHIARCAVPERVAHTGLLPIWCPVPKSWAFRAGPGYGLQWGHLGGRTGPPVRGQVAAIMESQDLSSYA
jgi:hypothetical protein